MKNNSIRNTIIAGTLCTALIVPSFALGAKVQPISLEDIGIIPISYKFAHWAETYIEQLSRNYDVEPIFKDNDLEAAIKVEDLQNLVKLIIDEEYDNVPDTMTREAVVYELTKIWAEKTGQDLEKIPVIKMLIYADTGEIDAKYNHSITVAYMKNIAKGKGASIFDPKADVRYGELAALIYNTDKAIQNELESNEQPILEEKFETIGSCELKDDKIVFNFELMNNYTKSKKLMFGSGQEFELTITDEEGNEVYKYSDDKFFTLALALKNIDSGESMKWQEEWDMTNKEGEKLTSGKYKAEINILVIPEENEEKIEESQLTTVINFDLMELKQEELKQEETKDDKGIIKSEFAKKIIEETADKLIHAISTKDADIISDFIHPVKGVRFTPYTNVSLDSDVVFNKEDIKTFFKDQDVYLWGHYDGKGDEISLTPSEYYEDFIYSEDFINAENIGYNEVLSSGNMIENQFEVYEDAIIVEYYFSGFNPDYAGLDWRSLRLVFEQYEGSWKLVGIIHNQWTI